MVKQTQNIEDNAFQACFGKRAEQGVTGQGEKARNRLRLIHLHNDRNKKTKLTKSDHS
jgi:hypothetical protein